MKALHFKAGRGIRLDHHYPLPVLHPGEALIRVRMAGICNTDLEITRGYLHFEGVPGHEFVGEVEAVASPEDAAWVGRRVVGDINAACGRCATCRAGRRSHCPERTTLGVVRHDGAFAEYLRLPVGNLLEVPASIPDHQAVFTEPLAAACEILEQYHLRPSERVAVVGDGKLGLLICQVLRLTGAEVCLYGRYPHKGAIAGRLGVEFREAPEDGAEPGGRSMGGHAAQESPGEGSSGEAGFDLVVECTGNAGGLELAKRLVRPRGTLVLKSTYHGTPAVPLSLYVVDEVTVLGSRCGPFAPALRLLERGLVEVEPLISAQFPIEEGLEAFEAAFGRGLLKVLIDVTASPRA